jgi:hypothetical protein
MKTAAEYCAMADECFKWAREAQTKEVRKSYLQLAQIWLNTASKIDGLPPTQSPSGLGAIRQRATASNASATVYGRFSIVTLGVTLEASCSINYLF